MSDLKPCPDCHGNGVIFSADMVSRAVGVYPCKCSRPDPAPAHDWRETADGEPHEEGAICKRCGAYANSEAYSSCRSTSDQGSLRDNLLWLCCEEIGGSEELQETNHGAFVDRLLAVISQHPVPASSFPCDPAKVTETTEAYVSGQITALRAQLAATAMVQQQMGDRMMKLLTLAEMQHEALVEAAEYVTATHASIAGAVGQDNAVSPVLARCREALAAYDRFTGGP